MNQIASSLDSPAAKTAPMLELRNVSRFFQGHSDFVRRGLEKLGAADPLPMLRAVNDVSLSLHEGEVVGLVGESGCGKSTLGRIAAGILPASSGEVLWKGKSLASLDAKALRQGKLATQMVFQNPFAALNPRMTVAEIIGEAPRIHGIVTRKALRCLLYTSPSPRDS